MALARAIKGARAEGLAVTEILLKDFPIPLFDGDTEATTGLPPKAQELRALIKSHAGLLIASPEHCSSVPAVLKNALDWLSRPHAGEDENAVFRGKAAALLGASVDDTGALRGLSSLSSILANLGVFVLPYPIGVARSQQAFGPDGELLDQKLGKRVEGVGAALARVLKRGMV